MEKGSFFRFPFPCLFTPFQTAQCTIHRKGIFKRRRAMPAFCKIRSEQHPMEYAIELRHITKTFGSVIANNDVSLDVRKGEILSLLGENGSGKTTLMNMIAGIYYPDSGEAGGGTAGSDR